MIIYFRKQTSRFAYIGMLMATILLGLVSVFGQSGNGGGNTFPNPLPQTPPAPDILFRDSFGQNADFLRPTGGHGELARTDAGSSINDFWVEYLGSKDARWISNLNGPVWQFIAPGVNNPNELYSPLQNFGGVNRNGAVISYTGLDTVGYGSTALMQLPGGFQTPFEVSIDAFVAPLPESYIALGLTNSNVTAYNLLLFSNIVLTMKANPTSTNLIDFELKFGNSPGVLVAHGTTINRTINNLKLRYTARTKTVQLLINNIDIGTFPSGQNPSKFVGFEGTGIVDNFVVRRF